jgi:hypothetical protein
MEENASMVLATVLLDIKANIANMKLVSMIAIVI